MRMTCVWLYLQEITGIEVPTKALYDIQIKRIHEYKRQHLNMFSVISRYLDIKKMSKEEKKKVSQDLIVALHLCSVSHINLVAHPPPRLTLATICFCELADL